MTGQQRSILATMGVDLWIPRTMSCQKKQAISLWRDQMIDVQLKNKIQHAENKTSVVDLKHASIKPADAVQVDVIVQTQAPAVHSTHGSDGIALPQTHLQDFANAQIQSAFTLEAYCLDHVILLLESSEISKEQRQLWTNIQAALSGVYSELKWPLPLQNFRDARGTKAYIQGFLDALAMDKRILILGDVELVAHNQAMQLASLQEMIDQPLLKRRLWQLMQSA